MGGARGSGGGRWAAPTVVAVLLSTLAQSGGASSSETTPPGDISEAVLGARFSLPPLGTLSGLHVAGPFEQAGRHQPVDSPPGEPAASDCTAHAPVHIRGDVGPLGFILGHHPATGEPLYRPGSGTVGGTGTADDPYRIEGWCIQDLQSVAAVDGVTLVGTRAHVVVTGNFVDVKGHGIRAQDVQNLSIRNNTLQPDGNGIWLETGTREVTLQGNDVRAGWNGVLVRGSSEVHIAQNQLTSRGGYGIWIDSAERVETAWNHVSWSDFGALHIESSAEVTVHHNEFVGTGSLGFPWSPGLVALGTILLNLHNNTFDRTFTAAMIHDAERPSIVDNRFRGTWQDLLLTDARKASIHRNQFVHGMTVLNTEREEVDHEIQATNTVGGKPIVYLQGVRDVTVPSGAGQVILADSWNVTVEMQDFPLAREAVQAMFSEELHVRRNAFGTNGTLQFYWVNASEVAENTMNGIFLYESASNLLRNNDVAGGIALFVDSNANLVRDNLLHDGFFGVWSLFSTGNVAEGNNIWANEWFGAGNLVGSLDARSNWWGCPEGPAHPDCDGVDGDVAVAPWRTEPNPAAGPSP